MQLKHKDEFAICVQCRNPIEKCVCVCPFCGERDKCECALFDAATGGWNCPDSNFIALLIFDESLDASCLLLI